MKTLIGLTLLVSVTAAARGQEPEPAPARTPAADRWQFKTAAAKTALAKYQQNIEQLAAEEAKTVATTKADYERYLLASRENLIQELQEIKTQATKADNLDEAVRLRDAIEELKKDGQPPARVAATKPMPLPMELPKKRRGAEELNTALQNTTWNFSSSAKSYKSTIRFNPNYTLTVSTVHEPGMWAAISGDTIVAMAWTSRTVQVWKLSPDGKTLKIDGEPEATIVKAQP